MGLRAVQPSIFGLAVLSFLLPFAHVSCASETETFAAQEAADLGDRTADLKGYELVTGGDMEKHFPGVAEGFAIEDADIRFGAEPFAVLALAAAAGGAAASILGPWHRRSIAGLIAGAAGILSVVALGLAPALRSLGLARVDWRLGYWTCLGLFVAATAISYLEYRRIPRPPPRPIA